MQLGIAAKADAATKGVAVISAKPTITGFPCDIFIAHLPTLVAFACRPHRELTDIRPIPGSFGGTIALVGIFGNDKSRW
jgi:hypothetical protein